MKILITGATGLIGRRLMHSLLVEGHEVKVLVRSPSKLTELPLKNIYRWTDSQGAPQEALSGCDAIIHLAGEGIADQRWSKKRKKRLWESRIFGTKNLLSTLESMPVADRPKLLIAGSAIGYYGVTSKSQDETSPRGQGFLSDLCVGWEDQSREAEKLGIRTVILRTGLVLAPEGGLLSKSAPVILGTGQQNMSWIHIEDMIGFIHFALKNQKLNGPYNLTAPNPVSNEVFTRAVATRLGFPWVTKVPASLIKLVLGEMSDAILADQRIEPIKTLQSGYQFRFPQLNDALMNLIGERSLMDCHYSAKQFIPLVGKVLLLPFIRKDIKSIFKYRQNKIRELYPESEKK